MSRDSIEGMKNWIAHIDSLRPHAHRQAEAGLRHPDQGEPEKTAADYQEPFDIRMGDRFRPQLSTR